MSQPILPITSYVAEAVVEKKAPWRMSSSVAHRMELKPFDKTSSFKKCTLLPSDPETEFVKRYFDQGKPSNLKIRRIYCLDNPASTKAFEGALPLMEADANKKVFQPNWSQGSDADRRKEIIDRWKSMGDLFGPFQVEDSEISQVKAFPLWHGSDFEKCLSIASSGFTFFGKHHFFDRQAEKGAVSSTDYGYFGSGIYFTDSARYASLYSPRHLLLSWVIMREPYPVINDKPHPEKGSDMRILGGKGAYQNYNAHYIPVASIDSNNPKCVDYYPCYDKQKAALDEFVVFEKAQAVARLWIELTEEGSDLLYAIPEMMASVEEGDLTQVQTWIQQDTSRLQAKTEEGETLAYAALSGNQLPLLKWLHAQDSSLIHQIRNDGRSLPFLAVLAGRREILNFLLDEGISYSSSRFAEEAKQFGYTKNRIADALASVNWSIWKIPPKTPYFSGREDVIAQMRSRFSSDPSQSLTKVALVGLGGMGKSTLAAAYAHTFQSRYSLVWWIEAEKSPRSGLKDLGIELDLAKIDTPEEEALEKVLSYLNKNPGWLLIFDNSESPALLQPLFPPFGKGHILISSRDASWANSLVVPSFSPRESLSLLSKHTGYPVNEEAEKLGEELGHLPLALTQAGAYMAETATSYKSYLDLYLHERKDLLSSQSLPEDYPHSVATTWKISLDKLKIASPEALPVLYRALYLAPDNIPKSILSEEGFSTLKLNNALKALKGYSLLVSGEESETLSIHRLVQTTLRDYLSPDEAERTKKVLQETVKKEWKFNSEAPDTWVKAKVLLTHLEAFSNLGADEETTGMLLNGLGIYFGAVEIDLVRSIDFLNRSLELRRKIFGEEHSHVATVLNNLGLIYKAQGNLLEAVKFHDQALQIRKKVYGEDHPAVADSLNGLGNFYLHQRDLSRAIEFYNQSLEIYKKVYSEGHPDVATSLHNLGLTYKAQGNLPLAIEFYEQSLEINIKVHGEEHPHVAAGFNSLGGVYQTQGNLPLAIEFYNKSLEIHKKVYGEKHPEVATSLHNLGAAYKDQGNLLLAIEFYNKSLEIHIKVYGEEHTLVAAGLSSLGNVYETQGNLPLAIEFHNKSLQIRKKVYGEEHPDVAMSLNNLGLVYKAEGNLPLAIEFHNKSLQIKKKMLGEEHPDVATSFHNLGIAYQDQGNLPLAIQFYNKSLEIKRKVYGEEHPGVASSLNNLGVAYETQGNLVRAVEFHNKSLQIRKKIYGEEHPDVATSLSNLGSAYKAQGDLQKAIEFYNESLRIRKKVYGEEHPSVATSLVSLGLAHQAQGDLRKAIEYYNWSLKVYKKIHGEEHSAVATILNTLGLVYKDQGDLPKAIECYSQSLQMWKKVYGEEHPHVAMTLNNLGSAYRDRGDFSKAMECLTQSLQVNKKVYGEEHPHIATSLSTLGLFCRDRGDLPKAIECLTQSLQISKKVYGGEHQYVLNRLNSLGITYESKRDLPKAIEFYSQALHVSKKIYGENHPETEAVAAHLNRCIEEEKELKCSIM